MRLKGKTHSFDIVFVLMAALVFAGSVLILLTMGAGVYNDVSAETREGGDEKLALAYIATKVRQSDDAGLVTLREFHGINAIAVKYISLDGTAYETLIYAYDGYLRELFYEEGSEFYPEDGQELISGISLSLTAVNEKLVKAEFTGRSGTRSIYVGLKSEGGWSGE